MTIAVFGGTGATGKHIISQALEKGIEVNALVRDPRRMSITGNGLHIYTGSALDQSDVEKTIEGADAVLSALGADHLGETTIYSESATRIVEAMNRHGVRRILAVGAVGQDPERSTDMPAIGTLFVKLVIRKTLEDMLRMQRILEASDLEWTLVWPPRLSDGPVTGSYRVENNKAIRKGRVISRADVAHFMVSNIDRDEHSRMCTAIAY